jgi:hypothetical protein
MSNQIVHQIFELFLEQDRMMRDLARNDLLLIEATQLEASPRELAVAAAVVRSTLYSVDALGDRIRQLAEQARNQ